MFSPTVSGERLEVMTSLQKDHTFQPWIFILFQKKEPDFVEEMVESGLSKNTICDNFQETYDTRK